MSDKLPEWPERPVLSQPVTQLDVASAWHMFEHKRAEATLARMEALVAEVIDLRDMADDRISGADRRRINELLAACERSER